LAKKYITQDKLKKNTLSDIFIFISDKRETTRREIEAETGFSWGTVSSSVAHLLEKGYIIEEKSASRGSVGRTTYTLRPAPDRFAALGLDINRSGLSLSLVGLDGSVKKELAAPFTAKTQNEVLTAAEALVQKGLETAAALSLEAVSLGIAMQGAVDGPAGVSFRFPHVADWQPINIKEHFGEKFSLPVYLAHDPKCMLLGELQQRTEKSCVLVRVDEGIGMSVLLDGKILYDTNCMELGHTRAVVGGKPCSCGRRGCLEAHASLHAMAESAGVTPEQLLSQPTKYTAVTSKAGALLGEALFNVTQLFRPQSLILTGKAAALSDFTKNAIAPLAGETDVTVNPRISAALGAATQSMKSAIKAFILQ